MQVVEYRRFIRHPICLPLSYKVAEPKKKDEEEEHVRSETRNVSLGGLLFSAKQPVKPGAKIVIKMPFEDKVFNVRAKAVRCALNSESNLYDIAVSFLRIHESFKVKMIEQIYLIAEYRDLLSLQLGREVPLEEASRKWIKLYSARFTKLHW